MKVEIEFTNELGNDITFGAKIIGEQVRIEMTGPSSHTVNNITRQEAERLHKVLGLVLDL